MSGQFSIGIFHCKRSENIGGLIRSAAAFNANYVFTIGRRYTRQSSDTGDFTKHVPCFHFDNIKDLKNHLPLGTRLVGIELTPDAKNLKTYSHLKQCCYLLGAEDSGLSKEAIEACHHIIQIPGASRCLNVSSAGTIVLYDRISKEIK